MYVIMENGYEMERFMDSTLWHCRILWFRSLILDCLVSCHDHCDFDESCVLDNDAKKKAVKKAQRTHFSFSVFLKCSFATFSNASKPYCFTNCFAHASTLLPAPFAKCIFHFASISSIFFKNA